MTEDNLSKHDKSVLKIALIELRTGSEAITIGDRVKDRLYVTYRLKLKYPFRKIMTYVDNGEVEII